MEDVKLSIYFHFQLNWGKNHPFVFKLFDIADEIFPFMALNYCQHIIREVQEKGTLRIRLDGTVIVHHAAGRMY